MNTTYKLQKAQRQQKTEKALQDIKQIGAFQIKNYYHKSKKFARLTPDQNSKVNDVSLKHYKAMTQQKFPIKNNISTVKRDRNLKNLSKSLGIRKILFTTNIKNSQCALSLQKMKSQNLSIQSLKALLRKFSIAPWQNEESQQQFN